MTGSKEVCHSIYVEVRKACVKELGQALSLEFQKNQRNTLKKALYSQKWKHEVSMKMNF